MYKVIEKNNKMSTKKKKKLNKKTKTISINKNKQNNTKTKKNFGVKTMRGGSKGLMRGLRGSRVSMGTIKREKNPLYGMPLGKKKLYNVGVINPTHIYVNLDAIKPENQYVNLDAIKPVNIYEPVAINKFTDSSSRSTAIKKLEEQQTKKLGSAPPPTINMQKLLKLLKAEAEKKRQNKAYEDLNNLVHK